MEAFTREINPSVASLVEINVLLRVYRLYCANNFNLSCLSSNGAVESVEQRTK